jgi:hypothetical protein
MKTIAILGASNDRNKFGNKAVRAYIKAGWSVFPVNLNEEVIEGLTVYKSMLDIPEQIELASFYLRPIVGEKVVDDVIKKGVKKVFLNPGSESEDIIKKLKDSGIEIVQACSIIAIGSFPEEFEND